MQSKGPTLVCTLIHFSVDIDLLNISGDQIIDPDKVGNKGILGPLIEIPGGTNLQ